MYDFAPEPIRVLLTQLQGASGGSTKGQDDINRIQAELSARLAILISESVAKNADALKTSGAIIQETTAKSAKLILEGIDRFTSSFNQASEDLRSASAQTSVAAKRLNAFTCVLALATVVMAGAVGWQAWELKRQTDLAERVASQAIQPTPAPKATAPNTK